MQRALTAKLVGDDDAAAVVGILESIAAPSEIGAVRKNDAAEFAASIIDIIKNNLIVDVSNDVAKNKMRTQSMTESAASVRDYCAVISMLCIDPPRKVRGLPVPLQRDADFAGSILNDARGIAAAELE